MRVLLLVVLCLQAIIVYGQSNNAILLNQQTIINVNNKQLITRRSYDIQINNRFGDVEAEISIPYSKLISVSKIEAYICNSLGQVVRKLKSTDISSRSYIQGFSLYEDCFVKEFTLRHNTYPYTLHYSYQESQNNFIDIDNWTPVIKSDIPTLQASLSLTAPKNYKIHTLAHNIEFHKSDTLESAIQYIWRASYKCPYENEIFAPKTETVFPNVIVVPDVFYYEKEGSNSSWQKFGNWQYSLIENIGELPDFEKAKVNQLLEGKNDPKQKVIALYHYLQDETRYVNVTIGTGGLKPYSASYVASNKYGDCKALSNYFRSLLHYVGIHSFYTKVYAGDKINKTYLNFPSQQFNHIIICVPLPKDTCWLDCTSDGPFNYLGTFTQNRKAFIIDKNKSRFVNTPALTKTDVLETRTINVSQTPQNTLLAHFRINLKGNAFEKLSYFNQSVSENEKAIAIRLNYVQPNFELLNFTVLKAHRDSTYIGLEYNAKNSTLIQNIGNEQIITVIPFDLPQFPKQQNRRLDLQFDYPIFKIDTFYYQLPPKCKPHQLTTNQHIQAEFGEYSLKSETINNKIIVTKSIFIKQGSYSAEKYIAFYKFINEIINIDKNCFIATTKLNL